MRVPSSIARKRKHAMPANPLQLGPQLKLWTYSSLAALFATGAIWFWLQRWGMVETDFGPTTHPLSAWMLRIHGLAAIVFLVVFGVLLPMHVRRSWQAGKNKLSGVGMLIVIFILTFTGWLLYYAGGENLRSLASNVHLWLGLAMPFIIIGHIIMGSKSQS